MLNITPIRAFQDNYIWMIRSSDSQRAAIIDPGDGRSVLYALREEGVTPVAILITHHHMDHVGGVRQLLEHYPNLPVFGPAHERIPGITRRLVEGDTVAIPEINAQFRVLEVPGHTLGHIAYYGEGALFCGDTLFTAGCGRLFEGSPVQMHASLSKIAALPGNTLVYCAHEYTLDNIAFAKWVEPNNPDLLQREQDARDLRARDLPTVPSRLNIEHSTNPFLRFNEPEVIAAAEIFAGRRLAPGAETFGVVRYWKDNKFD
jgi:hydroxyacylglutathione hydrolase